MKRRCFSSITGLNNAACDSSSLRRNVSDVYRCIFFYSSETHFFKRVRRYSTWIRSSHKFRIIGRGVQIHWFNSTHSKNVRKLESRRLSSTLSELYHCLSFLWTTRETYRERPPYPLGIVARKYASFYNRLHTQRPYAFPTPNGTC